MYSINDGTVFSVVGILPIDPDGPGFCTPLFRNDDNDQYFLQSLKRRKYIESFVFVGDMQGVDIFPHRSNGHFRVGDPPYVAFRMPNGAVIFDVRKRVHEHVIQEIEKFSEYPFLYFQIARLSRSTELLHRAVSNDAVAEAIDRKWLKLRPSEPQFTWSKYRLRRLREMVQKQFSAALIAHELGISRNAVLSRMKRENIGRFADLNGDLFSGMPLASQSPPDTSEPSAENPEGGIKITKNFVFAGKRVGSASPLPPVPPGQRAPKRPIKG